MESSIPNLDKDLVREGAIDIPIFADVNRMVKSRPVPALYMVLPNVISNGKIDEKPRPIITIIAKIALLLSKK